MADFSLHSASSLLAIVGVAAVAYILLQAYAVFANPLSKLPGPQYTKWTALPWKRVTLNGTRPIWVDDLHQKYGPVVRVSPDEVSLADMSAVKKIYKVGGPYMKSHFYDAFAVASLKEKTIFTQRDFKLHGEQRRSVSTNFSEKWVKGMEPYIMSNVQLAIQRMQEEHKQKGYVDTLKWFMFMATDVIGEAAFGESFKTLETGEVSQYIKDVGASGQRAVIRHHFPVLSKIMGYVPIQYTKDVNAAIFRMMSYGQKSVDRYWKALKADPDNVKPTLLTKEYAMAESGKITESQLRRDAAGYIVAGTDTTALTANWAVYLLTKRPDVEKQLIAEVSALDSDFEDEQLRDLPTLGNVIHETLRHRSIIQESLPRVVPAGGAEYHGHFLPGGTVVGIPTYTMHHNEEIFPDPQAFKPERWEEPTKEMNQAFLAWGGGSRVCIGMHFAQLELRHALANFYRTFNTGMKMSTAEGFSEDDMIMSSHFLVGPKGKRTLLQTRSVACFRY